MQVWVATRRNSAKWYLEQKICLHSQCEKWANEEDQWQSTTVNDRSSWSRQAQVFATRDDSRLMRHQILTLLDWHVRATLHKHRRRPWWEAALALPVVMCSVKSTIWRSEKCTDSWKITIQHTWKKNIGQYLKRKMSHVLYDKCVLNIYILAVPVLLPTSGDWGSWTQLSSEEDHDGNVPSLDPEKFIHQVTASWIKNHPCLEWIAWFIHDKCLKNRWTNECINFNSMNGDAYPKCTNREFKSKNENQWKLCHICITIAESMGFVFADGALISSRLTLLLQISANLLNKDSWPRIHLSIHLGSYPWTREGTWEILKKKPWENQNLRSRMINDTDQYTLLGINISHEKSLLKMIFLFPRWDMLVPWRVLSCTSINYQKSWNISSCIMIQLNMTQSIFTGLLYDSCLKPGSCKDPRRQAVITKSNGLSSVRNPSNGMQVPNGQRSIKNCTKYTSREQFFCTSMCSLCFGSKPATLPLHIARSQPVHTETRSRIAVNVVSKGHHLPKENLQTNLLQIPSYLQHVLFWISSFSNLWYHLTGFLGETIIYS